VRDDVTNGDIVGNDTNTVTLSCDISVVNTTPADSTVYHPTTGFVG
jgi:hypothetical protein